MKKNLFKSFLVFFLMMIAWDAQAQNTTRVYIDDFTIEPGESKELKVMFEGNVYITQVQFTITLPAGLEFENKGTARRPVYVTNTANSSGLAPSTNLIEADNQLIVFMSDGEQIGTEEQSGELAVVYIKAKSDIAGGNHVATLTDVEASDEKASRYVTPNQNIKITVPKQTTQYSVNILSGNTSYGTVSVSPNGNSTYEEGSVVTATATPKSGYHFVKWSDGTTTNPYRITVNGNVSLTAEFAPDTKYYTVNIQSGNTSYGTVTVSPNGNGSYEEGSVVTATATPKSGYHFVKWSDGTTTNPYRITVNGNVSLTAEFAPDTKYYTVNIQSGNTSYGTVTVSPNGNGSYEEGSVVTATATPKSGYHFVKWSDGTTTNPYRITVNGNVSLTAEFAAESTSNITFKDAAVKQICVQNWDTNGDGEISEAEAAAVKELGTVFYGNTLITSFDELRYFTKLVEIGNSAFEGCCGLTSVTIPNSVFSILGGAFSRCSGLTSVTIPNSVTSIEMHAFAGCSALTSLTIPNSVTSIGQQSFKGCISLTSLSVPKSLTSIGSGAFYGCSALTSIKVETGNVKYDSRNNCNALIETASNKLIIGCNNTVIPSTVTTIGNDAFLNCSGLTSVTIPNSVTSIGFDSFSGCSGLTSLTIPKSLTSIGPGAFDGCSGLTSIIVETGNVKYDSRNNCNALIETTSNELILGCKNTVIPNTVTSIGAGAFGECSGLTSITIPNSVTSIGNYAFQNCTGLKEVISEVKNPEAVSIGYDAFTSTSSDIVLFVPSGTLSAYKSSSQWTKWFKDIRELQSGETGIENVANPSVREDKDYYTIGGVKLGHSNRGLRIVRMRDGTMKKVIVK